MLFDSVHWTNFGVLYKIHTVHSLNENNKKEKNSHFIMLLSVCQKIQMTNKKIKIVLIHHVLINCGWLNTFVRKFQFITLLVMGRLKVMYSHFEWDIKSDKYYMPFKVFCSKYVKASLAHGVRWYVNGTGIAYVWAYLSYELSPEILKQTLAVCVCMNAIFTLCTSH